MHETNKTAVIVTVTMSDVKNYVGSCELDTMTALERTFCDFLAEEGRTTKGDVKPLRDTPCKTYTRE